jgi:hypothetical protein
MRLLLASTSFVMLSACATPQQRAISSYCENESYRFIPQQIMVQQVWKSVYVGQTITGYRNVCNNHSCYTVPVRGPLYENRLVNETVDINANQRAAFIQNCSNQALQSGMYSNLK